MKKLTLNDINKPVSLARGWTCIHIRRSKEAKVIMVIQAPDESVLVITNYPRITTRRKCRAIRVFMRRNRQNDRP